MGSTVEVARLAHDASGTRDIARPHAHSPSPLLRSRSHRAPDDRPAGCGGPALPPVTQPANPSGPFVQRPASWTPWGLTFTCHVPGRRRSAAEAWGSGAPPQLRGGGGRGRAGGRRLPVAVLSSGRGRRLHPTCMAAVVLFDLLTRRRTERCFVAFVSLLLLASRLTLS
jgi:hypothetical protein